MIGVVLSGGLSSRMGKDKGLVQTNNQPWASLAAQKIAALAMPVVISVNRFQLPVYAEIFKDNTLIPDDETLPVKGPLTGILSVHQENPSEDLLVLACDMPMMDSFILRQLQSQCMENPGHQAYVYASEEGLEPLVAIYAAGGLKKIMEMVKAGKLEKFSMHAVLENLQVFRLQIPQQHQQYFRNFNEPLF